MYKGIAYLIKTKKNTLRAWSPPEKCSYLHHCRVIYNIPILAQHNNRYASFRLLQCDLDEPCDPRVQCTNLRPGYKCGQCPPGYTTVGPSQGIGAEGTRRSDEGRHRCMDIDECADGRNGGCAPNSLCINTEVRPSI